MIEIVSGPAPSDVVPAVEVTTYPSPLGDAFAVARVCAYERAGTTLTVRDVIPTCRMRSDTATSAALLYAQRMGIRRIYVHSLLSPTSLDSQPVCAG